jgi:hypothetical protein
MKSLLVKILLLGILLMSPFAAYAQSDLAVKSSVLDRLQTPDAKAAFQACLKDESPNSLTVEIALFPDSEPAILQSEPAVSEDALTCLSEALSQLDLPAVTQEVSVISQVNFSLPKTDAPGNEEPEPPVVEDIDEENRRDLDDTRVIYAPTAIPRGKGVLDFTAHNIGLWDVEGGLTDNSSIGLKFLLPVFIYEVMPYARGSIEVADDTWLGGTVLGGIAGIMDDADMAWFAGGSVQMTVGRDPFMFNVSFLAQAMGAIDVDDPILFMLPNIGMSARVGRKVKLNLEYHLPIVAQEDSLEYIWGIVGYGVRILGERIYGDISFFCPIFDGAADLYRYLPLGIPMLSFGFQFNTGAPADITSGADASAATNSWIRDFALSL